MDVLTPERLFTLIAFLGLLGMVWALIWYKQKQAGHVGPVGATPLSITAVKSLGDGSRMILVHAAGQDVLIVTQRKAAAAMIRVTVPEVQQ